MGAVQSGMNGPTAISHSEIRAFALNWNVELEGEEGGWLAAMSAAYAGEINRSHDKDTVSPMELTGRA